MKKPDSGDFEGFARAFEQASNRAGKKQYVVPYFIASHPGSDLNSMIELAVFLKKNGYKPDQVQDFIPAPFDIATCMYHTGLDPFTGEEVYIAKHLRDRKLQRALLQFFKPENYFEVRKALLAAGRSDLIGPGCECLIPTEPPKAAREARISRAGRELEQGKYVHQIAQAPGSRAGETAPGDRLRMFADDGDPRLAAAVELLSPRNKDRPAARQAFAVKCVGYLQQGSSVVVVDTVTTRRADVNGTILSLLGVDVGAIAAAGCQASRRSLTELWGVRRNRNNFSCGLRRSLWPSPCRPSPCGSPLTSPCRSIWKPVT